MSELQRQVIEFHRVFEQPIVESPTVPPDERVRLRVRLVLEETIEFLESCFDANSRVDAVAKSARDIVQSTRADLMVLIAQAKVDVHMPGVADALADIDYVVEGSRLEFGLNGPPIAREVHRSNMAKAKCDGCDGHGATPDGEACSICAGSGWHLRKREDGKVIKPECWRAPDIAGELKKQNELPTSCGLGGVLDLF
jgi:predicted HAD superfamily Cof-like phosphohydrolase